jgi:hypothetical protein
VGQKSAPVVRIAWNLQTDFVEKYCNFLSLKTSTCNNHSAVSGLSSTFDSVDKIVIIRLRGTARVFPTLPQNSECNRKHLHSGLIHKYIILLFLV